MTSVNLGPDAMHPARDALAVTPSDSVNLGLAARALYVGGTGNVAVITRGGQTITFNGVQGGSILPVRVSRVLVTGTTATNIVALA
jgi:hypothetical protein